MPDWESVVWFTIAVWVIWFPASFLICRVSAFVIECSNDLGIRPPFVWVRIDTLGWYGWVRQPESLRLGDWLVNVRDGFAFLGRNVIFEVIIAE